MYDPNRKNSAVENLGEKDVTPSEVSDLVGKALHRRQVLRAPDLEALRLFHGWSEGIPGLVVDRYGRALIARAHEQRIDLGTLALEALAAELSPELTVLKVGKELPRCLTGTMPSAPMQVRENQLLFSIEPWQRGNPGLHLDARPARQWIAQNSQGRRVLNLFSFTGSLGLAASVGGALSVTHVDMQGGILERCRENYRLNALSIDDRDLMRVNIYQHLRKAKARRRKYGAIIVDPPPYTQDIKSDRTPGGRGMETLCKSLSHMLDPGGWLLCFFHHSEFTRQQHEAQVLGAAEVPLQILWRGESGADFPEAEPNRKLRLTAFVRA